MTASAPEATPKSKLLSWADAVSKTAAGRDMMTLAATRGQGISSGKAWWAFHDEAFPLLGKHIGSMERLAAAVLDAQVDVDAKGDISAEEKQKREDQAQGMVDGAASFMLNIAVVCALFLVVLLEVVIAEPEPHPLIEHACRLILDPVELHKDEEANILVMVLQQAVGISMLPIIVKLMYIIATTSKAYGHLTYWCADLEAKVWYSRTKNIQFVQNEINSLLPMVVKSILPYICVTRGPIMAVAFYVAARCLDRQYKLFNITGRCLIMGKYATRISEGTCFERRSGRTGWNESCTKIGKADVSAKDAAMEADVVLQQPSTIPTLLHSLHSSATSLPGDNV